MTRMKRSEFKALVKECVRECLREVLQEQISPIGLPMQEMTTTQRQLPATTGPIINPMDDYQMRLRQELMQQKGLMQQQLQRQSIQQQLVSASPMQQQVGSLSELAGLGVNEDPFDQSASRRYNTSAGSGYLNPSDRIKLAQMNDNRRMIDPTLDAPVAGSMRQMPQQQRPMRLDPDLDTPLNGGDMRPPDPNVMRNIFEDTARTTYAKQAAAGHVRPGASAGGGGGDGFAPPADKYAEIVSQHNPEELFPGSQNWGALAFQR